MLMKSKTGETPKRFFAWLDKRLEVLGMNDNQLSIKADISNSVISKARSGLQPIGFEACKALASPLGVSDIFILRMAGHLSSEPVWSAERDEWDHLFDVLPEDKRNNLLTMGQALARSGEKHGNKT